MVFFRHRKGRRDRECEVMTLKHCPICWHEYAPERPRCPVCGAYHVIGNVYYDVTIQIVAAYGALRASQDLRRPVWEQFRYCDGADD